MDVAVWRISDHFLPSFVVFVWKPLANKDDLVIKGYKNYKLIDLNLKIENMTPFETFFLKNSKPISCDHLISKVEEARIFEALDPELIIPILGPSGLYGLVLVGSKVLEDEYNPTELVYLHELMSFVSQAIQNYLHYDRTLRDVKTGLFNNGFFMTRLNEEVARARRGNSVSSIIIIDVDKFKVFNDTYGHLAGDKVLECLALVIKQGLRTEDIPSRFGGEEFTILLPDSDRKAAWIVAERLRRSVAAMKIPWDSPLPQVTISLGIFTFCKDTDMSSADIIRRADEALYMSKERGRNRTTIWGSGLLAKIELLNLLRS
jgi:diguanylate cyclase (GGDEF)-like protein